MEENNQINSNNQSTNEQKDNQNNSNNEITNQEDFYKKYNFSIATPMMQQYIQSKFKHQSKILLFRLGDFYEIFYEDAIIINNVLHLTLTKRNRIPMCGIPVVSLNIYLKKLIKLNYKIAICEQTETPEEAKAAGRKIVNRDITQIITPGTVLADDIQDNNKPNYIGCIHIIRNNTYLTYGNIALNNLFNIQIKQIEDVEKLNIIELLISENNQHLFAKYKNITTIRPHNNFNKEKCIREIKQYYSITSITNINKEFIISLGALLTYLRANFNNTILPLPKTINTDEYLILNHITAKNLDIFTPKIGLSTYLNHTVTRMGNRLLYQYLQYPLKNKQKINTRFDIVEFFMQNQNILNTIRYQLKFIHDLERLNTLVSIKQINIKQVYSIAQCLEKYSNIQDILYKFFGMQQNNITDEILFIKDSHYKITQLIKDKIICNNDEIFIQHHKANILQKELCSQQFKKQNLLTKYKQLTNIDTLKFCHNNIIGHYIETTNKNTDKITAHSKIFQHKQSTLNHTRYTTTEYQNIMNNINYIEHKIEQLQKELFLQLIEELSNFHKDIKEVVAAIAKIDLLSSFAHLALKNKWIRPQISKDKVLYIEDGKHPLIQSQQIVSNDCNLTENNNVWIITGPNMGGKSTFLRQNALFILLSHIGCFIPAKKAIIGITDNIFSRIGANDKLHEQESTFMVEMNEIAHILSQATDQSFIIIDEIGRGTSHTDGIPLASAITNHIYSKIQCRTIIATHYHSMPVLTQSHYQMKILHNTNNIVFTYKVIPGKAKNSYGLNVAKLAGIPKTVITEAENIQNKNYTNTHSYHNTNSNNNPNNSSRKITNTPLPANGSTTNNKSVNYPTNIITNTPSTPQQIHNINLHKEVLTIYNTIKTINLNNTTPLELMNQIQNIQNNIN
ncbi:MAG: DNA mismatch repair protein MutS [Pseudomonadota bacterium]